MLGASAATSSEVRARIPAAGSTTCRIQPEDRLLEPAVGLEDHPDQPLDLGCRAVQHDERLLDLDRVLPEVRRPPPDPEPDRDLAAGPSRRDRDLFVVEASQARHRQVQQRVEVRPDVVHRAGRLDAPLGDVGAQLVRHERRRRRRLGQPPRGEAAVEPLAW